MSANTLSPRYEKWLNEEVVYIISAQERSDFLKLSADGEREAFIERFWKVRDTDPSTEENEFRKEHYARIKYADEHFGDGMPGWKTDRGRIWIMHGPPDDMHYEYGGSSVRIDIENPTTLLTEGAIKERLFHLTFDAPETETWVYRHIAGARNVTSNFEVIFSRTSPDHIYRLNQALRSLGNTVLTLEGRYQRDNAIMVFIRGHHFGGPYRVIYAGEYRFQDLDDFYQSIFHPNRLPTVDGLEYHAALVDLERSPGEFLMERLSLGRKLKEKVRSRVFFEDLPIDVRLSTLQSESGSTILPVSLGIPDVDERGHALGVSGDTFDLMLELVNEQGDVAASLVDSVKLKEIGTRERGIGKFLYQTRLAARPGRYRLSVYGALRQHNSSALRELTVRLPDYMAGGLQMSDLLLFDRVISKETYKESVKHHDLPTFLGQTNPVFLKDYVLIPSSDGRFRRSQKLTAFFEVYGPRNNSNSSAQALRVRCRLKRQDGLEQNLPEKLLSYLTDSGTKRTTYGISIPLLGFSTGEYQVEFDVYDASRNESVNKSTSFVVY